MKYFNNYQVLASSQRSAGAGYSTAIPARTAEYAITVIYITAKSGAPTLAVSLQCSAIDPEIDNYKWRTVYQEDLITDTNIGTPPKIFGGHRQVDFSGWLRIAYTVAGATTPKLTFSANIETK